MFDRNGKRTQLKAGDVLSFRQAPSTGTLTSVFRSLRSGEKKELYLEDGTTLFQLRFFSFEQCGELASFIASVAGLTVVGGKTSERGDLRTAEFEVHTAE
jgi:hypothetical protein